MSDPRADLYGDLCTIMISVKNQNFTDNPLFPSKMAALNAVSPHFFPSALDFGTGLVYN